jgi:hypothetical protein
VDDREAVKKMLRGHAAAAEMQKRLLVAEGPRKETSFADALSLFELIDDLHGWPSVRDRLAEDGVEEVRRRWAKIQHEAREAAGQRRAPRRKDSRQARTRAR